MFLSVEIYENQSFHLTDILQSVSECGNYEDPSFHLQLYYKPAWLNGGGWLDVTIVKTTDWLADT